MRFSTLRSVLLLASACLFLPACDRDDPNAPVRFAVEEVPFDGALADLEFVPTLDGPLRIVAASPGGALAGMPPGLAVTVSFSAPMIALEGDVPSVPAGTLTLDPPVAGTVTWEGTRTLVFRPDGAWPAATRFTVRVSNDLPDLEGRRMEGPLEWTFDTPVPRVAITDPEASEPFFAPTGTLRIRFDAPVDGRRAGDFVRLIRVEGATREVPVTVSADGDSAITVSPRSALESEKGYELVLSPGLPSREGPLGIAEEFRLPFRTYGAPRLVAADQAPEWWEEARKEFDPDRAVTLRFSTPVSWDAVRAAMRLEPAVEWPASFADSDPEPRAEHRLPGVFDANTAYRVSVVNLVDAFGQRLVSGQAAFLTGRRVPDISMPEGVMILEREVSARLPVRVTNLEGARVSLVRLSPDDFAGRVRAYDPNHWYGDLGPDVPEPVPAPAEDPVAFDVPDDRPTTTFLDLDRALRGGTGVLALHLATDIRDEWSGSRRFVGIAIVTKLGITAKFSPHDGLVVVTKLADATPVSGATVTLRDGDGKARWSGRTDAAGRAVTPGWASLGIPAPNEWNSPTLFATASTGDDWTFTSNLYRDGIEAWRFGMPFEWSPEPAPHAGSVFSDRGLYRAGEPVHVKGVLRRRVGDAWQPVTDSVRALVVSPRDEVVVDRAVALSDLGTLDFDWTVPTSASQGRYRVRLVAPGDTAAVSRQAWERGDLAEGTFRVEAFRTATFAVTAATSRPSYVAGDLFEGSITGRYYFGAEMAGMPVRANLTRFGGSYTPPGLEGYDTAPYRFDAWEGNDAYRAFVATDTLLDASGRLDRRLFLPGTGDGSPTTLSWEGAVTGPDGQEYGGRTEIVVHPGQFYLGLRPSTGFVEMASDPGLHVDLVSVSPSGGSLAVRDVRVDLVRREWISVREVGRDGRTRWRSEAVETPVTSQEVSTRAGRATRLRFRVRQGGLYVIRATANDVRGNLVRAETLFWAAGEGYVAWERSDDDRLELVADRDSYAPGDVARILVPNPYEKATALVTVERDGVLSSQVVTLEGSAPSIRIPIEERHLPNVFVGVVLLSGRTAQPSAGGDVGAPSFRAGYVQLPVDPVERRLEVEMSPSADTLKPGDAVTVRLRVLDAKGRGVRSEVTFSAADAGVVDLIGYRLPDPFETFWADRPLSVTTAESRSHLVRQRSFGQKEEDEGGGGGDPNARLRSDFRPSAHWDPRIVTDGSGRAEVTFRLPESLTTWRLMAVAVSTGDRFGRGESQVTATQPLVLQPALPRFARAGDRFDAAVLVTNRTGRAGSARVSLLSDGFTATASRPIELTLAAGETRRVAFPGAIGEDGEARFTFEAGLGTERDALVLPIPVHPVAVRTVTGSSGSTESEVVERVRPARERIPGRGSLAVRVAPTALVGLGGAARSLFEYPYGCLEQRTSRVRPLLVADALLDAYAIETPLLQRERLGTEWLAGLEAFRTTDGFALWNGGSTAHPYVTAYVLLTLVDARAAGLEVDPDLVRHASRSVETWVRNAGDRPAWLDEAAWSDTRAFLLYALARAGVVLESELASLSDAYLRRPGASIDGLSHLARAMAQPGVRGLDTHRKGLDAAIRSRVRSEAGSSFVPAPTGDGFSWLFASDTRSTALALSALAAGPDARAAQPVAEALARSLLSRRSSDGWATTQDNAAVVDALAAYHAAYEAQAPAFTAVVRTGSREWLRHAFAGRSTGAVEASLAADAVADSTAVRLSVEGRGRLFYDLTLESWTSGAVRPLDQGLAVRRTIERLDRAGRPVSSAIDPSNGPVDVAHGDAIAVTLRVIAPRDRNYVVVDDALPAGFEAVNSAFVTTPTSVSEETGPGRWWGSFNHAELRDDRVLLFADRLDRGEHTYRYVVRATASGTFAWPPASAEAMYEPTVRGRTGSSRVTVSAPR